MKHKCLLCGNDETAAMRIKSGKTIPLCERCASEIGFQGSQLDISKGSLIRILRSFTEAIISSGGLSFVKDSFVLKLNECEYLRFLTDLGFETCGLEYVSFVYLNASSMPLVTSFFVQTESGLAFCQECFDSDPLSLWERKNQVDWEARGFPSEGEEEYTGRIFVAKSYQKYLCNHCARAKAESMRCNGASKEITYDYLTYLYAIDGKSRVAGSKASKTETNLPRNQPCLLCNNPFTGNEGFLCKQHSTKTGVSSIQASLFIDSRGIPKILVGKKRIGIPKMLKALGKEALLYLLETIPVRYTDHFSYYFSYNRVLGTDLKIHCTAHESIKGPNVELEWAPFACPACIEEKLRGNLPQDVINVIKRRIEETNNKPELLERLMREDTYVLRFLVNNNLLKIAKTTTQEVPNAR